MTARVCPATRRLAACDKTAVIQRRTASSGPAAFCTWWAT